MKLITTPTRLNLSSSYLAMIAALALCVVGCADDNSSEESVSGKKKIAYAPYQDAQITHHSPKKIHAAVAAMQERLKAASNLVASAVISPDQPSTFTTPKITESAQLATGERLHEGSMIAAGYPGGPGAAPKSGSKPTHGAAKAPSSMPASRPAARPAGHPSSQAQQPVAVNNYIYGEISIDPKLVGNIKAGSVLFVIVRRHVEGGSGMLIAATKQANITKDSFPLKYVVKQQDAMMGAPLVGKVTVSARIDQDGDAISKQPGDLVTGAVPPAMVGQNPVKLTIAKAL